MEATIVLLFVILSATAALVAIFVFKKKPEHPADISSNNYAEGLNLLLAGDRSGALKKLKETVKYDSQNIDAYLKIGDIFREFGQVEKAVNVHKYLTVRTNLSNKQHNLILNSLALDYVAAKEYEKALQVTDKVLELVKDVPWAHQMKCDIYESNQEWSNAFHAYKVMGKKEGGLRNAKLAYYRVQEALELLKDDKNKEAYAKYKEAIKIEPTYAPGYIYLADLYESDNNKRAALETLREFIEKVPSQSHLAFGRLKDILFEGGVYSEIENLYKEIIAKQPDNFIAYLALAENYEKKGELDLAIEVCEKVLEREAENKAAQKYLVRFYHEKGQDEEALRIALQLLEEPSAKPGHTNELDLAEFVGD